MSTAWRTLREALADRVGRRVRATLNLPALIARAPLAVSIVLGVAIAAQAADVMVTLSGEMTAGANALSDMRTSAPVGARSGLALTDVMSAHLFGVAPQAATAANARAVSRSPLVLTGIIATNDPHDGFAIIGTSASHTHALYVGSTAAPGTVLVAVHPFWVVLRRGSERLTLKLPRKSLTAPGVGDYVRQRLANAAPAMPVNDAESDSGQAFALPEPLQKPPTPDGGVIVSAFQLAQTSIQGVQGMRISGTGLNRKVLESLGLVGGDVITQINGIPVGARNAPDLIDAIQSGNATLTVVKDGQASWVTLDQSAVAAAAALYRQADSDY